MKNKILILYNQPHKAQMVKLRDWLQRNLPQYHYELCKQLKFLWKMKTGSSAIHAILTYNKSLYWKSVVKQIIKYCEKGGKVIALHHNISSMMLKRPEWLEFAKIQITKGKNVRYPWAATEGGTLHIYNLSDTHPITSDNLEYNEKGPAVNFNPTNKDLLPSLSRIAAAPSI